MGPRAGDRRAVSRSYDVFELLNGGWAAGLEEEDGTGGGRHRSEPRAARRLCNAEPGKGISWAGGERGRERATGGTVCRVIQPYAGGGMVAFEVAQQFRKAGEKVDALLLVDTWPSNIGITAMTVRKIAPARVIRLMVRCRNSLVA